MTSAKSTRPVITFLIVSVGLFMVTLDNLVVSTALPVIRVDLNAPLESLEWMVNAYTLSFAVFLLTGAALGDRFGRRKMFALGVMIFSLASAAAALAPAKGYRIVTYHHAFPYFTRRYGLDLIGVIEEVPDVEPSPKYLAVLLKVMRATDVKAIFTEPQFSPKLAQRISRDAKIPVAELDTLEIGPLKPTAYEEGLRRNLNTLLKHLK